MKKKEAQPSEEYAVGVNVQFKSSFRGATGRFKIVYASRVDRPIKLSIPFRVLVGDLVKPGRAKSLCLKALEQFILRVPRKLEYIQWGTSNTGVTCRGEYVKKANSDGADAEQAVMQAIASELDRFKLCVENEYKEDQKFFEVKTRFYAFRI